MSTERIAREWNAVAHCLRNWPCPVPEGVETPHLRRLAAALSSLDRDGQSVGPSDLGSLLRQALRVGLEAPSEFRVELRLTIPSDSAGAAWPSIAEWRKFGVEADQLPNGRLSISAAPWRPDWINSDDPIDQRVSEAYHDAGRRRATVEVPADPFVAATFPNADTDFTTYTSDAHRQAVRSVLSCREGATVFVNLPTGAGKSTVAIAPSFVRGTPTGVSLMVVPTVALALDQERRVRELLGDADRPFAYTGSTPSHVREGLRRGIRQGTQPILFVSPEAITRSLAPALFAAAREGHLRYFIIDEAHLVDQWGTEFRPEFQSLAGLRAELLAQQSAAGHDLFRTVIMTATMPPSTADLLYDLFHEPGPVEAIVANVLRPEPSYSTAWFETAESRLRGVLDALDHLPRPAIVYASRPRYAQQIFDALAAGGHRRIALFTGETQDEERRRILNGFRADDIDVVVATSAFGLGVDQDDVRTIVHACIPETIDRYYQEVGRAGRDGRTSISLVCWTDFDRKDAYSFSHPRLIDEERGLARWNTMLMEATQLGNRLSLPLASLRPGLERAGDENEKWNLRTLSLFLRAGLLVSGWDAEDGRRDETTVDDTNELRQGTPERTMVVQMKEGSIDGPVWRSRVVPVRDRVRKENDQAHRRMIDALRPNAPICELLQQAYDLSGSQRFPDLPNGGRPALICGGCPAHPHGKVAGQSPRVPPVRQSVAASRGHDGQLLRVGRVSVVTYLPPRGARQRSEFESRLCEMMRHLIGEGLRLVVTTPDIAALPELHSLMAGLHLVAPDRVFLTHVVPRFETLELEWVPRVPLAVVAPPRHPIPIDWFTAVPAEPGLVLVVPSDSVSPERDDRLLTDLRPDSLSLEQLVESWSN